MEVFWTILVFGGLFALMIYGFVEKSKDKAKHKDRLAVFSQDIVSQRGFDQSRLYKGPSGFVAIDSGSNQLAFATAPDYKTMFVGASKIMSVSIYEDQRSIIHAHRGRQVSAALVGGAVAGSTGALVGGLGAKAKSTDMVNSVTLRVELDLPSKPLLDMPFLKNQTQRGGYVHEQTSKEARTWSSLLTAIMRKSEGVAPTTTPTQERSKNAKLEDLVRLGELKNSGILTDEEFDKEKARILAEDP